MMVGLAVEEEEEIIKVEPPLKIGYNEMGDEAKQQLTSSEYLDFMPSDAGEFADLILKTVEDKDRQEAAVDGAEYFMLDTRIKVLVDSSGGNGHGQNLEELQARRDELSRKWTNRKGPEGTGWGSKERTFFELTRARCYQVMDLCSDSRQKVQAPGEDLATDFCQAIVKEAGRQI